MPELDPEVIAFLATGAELVPPADTSAERAAFLTSSRRRVRKDTSDPARSAGISWFDSATGGPHESDLAYRVYRHDDEPPGGLLMYFHGGGWVGGSLDSQHVICLRLAKVTGCVIVSVAYRLAPEHPYPAPLDDCCHATRWAFDNIVDLAGRPVPIGLAGASSGGNLAAGVALRLRDDRTYPIRLLALFYPVLDSSRTGSSYMDRGTGYFLTSAMMTWYWRQYADPRHQRLPEVSPLHSPDLSGLPATIVVGPRNDPLSSEGREFARRLIESDVPVHYLPYLGQIHSFLGMFPDGAAAQHAYARVGAIARTTFADAETD